MLFVSCVPFGTKLSVMWCQVIIVCTVHFSDFEFQHSVGNFKQ
jgi:hypothetical protein